MEQAVTQGSIWLLGMQWATQKNNHKAIEIVAVVFKHLKLIVSLCKRLQVPSPFWWVCISLFLFFFILLQRWTYSNTCENVLIFLNAINGSFLKTLSDLDEWIQTILHCLLKWLWNQPTMTSVLFWRLPHCTFDAVMSWKASYEHTRASCCCPLTCWLSR